LGATAIKEIKAIVQSAMASGVISAFKALPGLAGATVSEVKGFGKSRAAGETDTAAEDEIEYSKKVKIEIVPSFVISRDP
jgi:nitrogen regulatory protein P-II 1